MNAKYNFLHINIIFSILIIIIKPNDEIDPNQDIIKFSERQGYNITNSEDIFFNDICQFYSSKEKKDVSLEYRRKYYYYPNGKQLIIDNDYRLQKIFPEIKRDNIFMCFKSNFNISTIYLNIALYFIIPIFIFQILSLIICLTGKYKNASENTPEEFFEYKKRAKRKKFLSLNLGKQFFISAPSSNNINENNYNTETFQSFQEENNNKDCNNSIFNNNKEEEISKNEVNIYNNKILNEEIIEKEEKEEPKKDDLNTTGDLPPNCDEDETKEEKNNKEENIIEKRNINPDEIYTFGGMKIGFINSKDKEENQSHEDKKILKSDLQKAKQTEYVFNKMNNKYIFNVNNNIKSVEPSQSPSDILLTNEELFYSGFSVAILKDKRSFKEMYFDYLSHSQIIFYFMPNFYIYEDYRITMVYYSMKLILYFIIIIFFFNDASAINQIYDNNFSFLDYFLISLLTSIIVNSISQILFMLTNSKRNYIRYIGKMKKSLFGKKRIFRYVINDVIDLINNNLLTKLFILMFFIVILFFISFFFSICFCISYFNTQFIVLKCIIICIFISQIFPFLLVLIPTKLRKSAIQTKNNNLYQFSRAVDSLFLP